MNRAADSVILRRAFREKRIIVTMDLDFPAILSFTHAQQPGVVLFRMNQPTPEAINKRLEALFDAYAPTIIESAICIVEVHCL